MLYFRVVFVMGHPFLLPYQAFVSFHRIRFFINMGNLNSTVFFINSKRTNASCVTLIYDPENIAGNGYPPNNAYCDDGGEI